MSSICPTCSAPLQLEPALAARCAKCGEVYPEVGGVRVLAISAEARIAQAWMGVSQSPVDVPQETLVGARPERTAQRAARAAQRLQANKASVMRHCVPLQQYLAEHKPRVSFADVIAQQSVWKLDDLLPYFHADWASTPSFLDVCRQFDEAIARHAPGQSSVVVLGCGASGLLAHLSSSYAEVIGVDLSLPTLMMARQLLDGRTLDITIADTPMTLKGATPPTRNARLVAADVFHLPFPDGSVPLLVSQYLLDIVADPLELLCEINRVLAPGGTWLNFGMPFSLLEDPGQLGPRVDEDMKDLLAHCGFDLLDVSRRSYDFLNRSSLDPWIATATQQILFFTARKHASLERSARTRDFDSYFAGDKAALLARKPKLAPQQVVTLYGGTTFSATGQDQIAAVSVTRQLRRRSEPQTLPNQAAPLLRALFESVDGSTDVSSTAKRLIEAARGALTERDVVHLLRQLGALRVVEL